MTMTFFMAGSVGRESGAVRTNLRHTPMGPARQRHRHPTTR